MTDKCIYCEHEGELNDPLGYKISEPSYEYFEFHPVCQDALACGRRRQKAEDDRRDPPGCYTGYVGGIPWTGGH